MQIRPESVLSVSLSSLPVLNMKMDIRMPPISIQYHFLGKPAEHCWFSQKAPAKADVF